MKDSKRCSKCRGIKPLTEFHKCSKSKDGCKSQCKICRFNENLSFKELGIYILLENKICSVCQLDKPIKEFGRDLSKKDGYYAMCKLCANQKVKDYYANNPGFKKEQDSKYYIANKEDIIKQTSQYSILKYNNDVSFKLRKDISKRVNLSLKKTGTSKNGKSTLDFLPYSIRELKEHIEKQFEPWMNWSNQGSYRLNEWDDSNPATWKWNIDHIIPHSNFYYTSMEDQEFKDCWALSNLRPYSAKQNILDGARS